ncbi:MAG: hypothetical protein SynsKO_21190 [Synoicihabitans sp.]
MYGFFYRLGTWLLSKLGAAVLIVVLALLGVGLWLFVNDQVDAETRRVQYLDELRATQVELVARKAEALAQLEALREKGRAEEKRVQEAQKIIQQLMDLRSWWQEWFGNSEQQAANEEQITRMTELAEKSRRDFESITDDISDGEIALADLDFQLASVERDLTSTEESQSAAAHYLRDAWERSKWYLAVALAAYFVGPSIVKTIAFFLIAPWLARGKPIRFAEELVAMPNVRASNVSTVVNLWPGEILSVKESFLQSSDDSLNRKTRFVLDWSIPFTSLACGLTELVELRNGQAGENISCTLSNGDDPHTELSVIEVPEDASLILRPSFLVGVITKGDERVEIRRRWTLFRWQAWITLQFRFFEFVGPCRLVVAGSRGVRAEILRDDKVGSRPARRTNQRATIGFTPNLDYMPVRAETFWGYYRNMNPLFDDLFAGKGLFVLQETANDLSQSGPKRFWSTVWNSILKVFGI